MATRYLVINLETTGTKFVPAPWAYMDNDYETLDSAVEAANFSTIAVLKIDLTTGKTEQVYDALQIDEIVTHRKASEDVPGIDMQKEYGTHHRGGAL